MPWLFGLGRGLRDCAPARTYSKSDRRRDAARRARRARKRNR